MIDTVTGNIRGAIDTGGHAAHNTIVSLNGAHVYMGPRLSNYLVVADTRTNHVIKEIGPVKNGVRPFTINGAGTLAFIETSGFLGFQVANIATGQILYTVPVNGFTFNGFNQFAPSHGISLSPDEKELYISDWPHSYVHVFDVRHLPRKGPKKVADIKLHSMNGSESPCVSTNCMKEGWVLHSRDGRFVYIGDAGDVIDTATRKSVAYLAPLANTRKFLEIDWANSRPVFASSRYGVGYVTRLRQARTEAGHQPDPSG
jgi:DNA-binding beta-propeller fold protein YncE